MQKVNAKRFGVVFFIFMLILLVGINSALSAIPIVKIQPPSAVNGYAGVDDVWVNETGDIMTGKLKLTGSAGLWLNVTNCNTIDTDSEGYIHCGIDEGGAAGDGRMGTNPSDYFMYNDSSYIMFNATRLNETIDARDSDTIYAGVDDVWVNETGDIMTGNLTMGGNWIIDFITDLGWFNLTDFPNDCGVGEYVFGIWANGTFRCREDITGTGYAGVDDVWVNETGDYMSGELNISNTIYLYPNGTINANESWNTGNVYDNMNRVCTRENGLCNATSTTFYPTSFLTVEGTESGGNNIGNLSFYDNEFFNITEVAGISPLLFYINFTGINTSFVNGVLIRERYYGGQGHEINFEIWDYVINGWEGYYVITDQSGYVVANIPILDSADHLKDGTIQVRFDHIQNGVATHKLSIDFVQLYQGTASLTNFEHDSLSGRDEPDNHPQYVKKAGDVMTGDLNITLNDANLTVQNIIFGKESGLQSILYKPDTHNSVLLRGFSDVADTGAVAITDGICFIANTHEDGEGEYQPKMCFEDDGDIYFENTQTAPATTGSMFRINMKEGLTLSSHFYMGGNMSVSTDDVVIWSNGTVECGAGAGDGYPGVDDVWVNETGDTMTGDLIVNANVYAYNLSGNLSGSNVTLEDIGDFFSNDYENAEDAIQMLASAIGTLGGNTTWQLPVLDKDLTEPPASPETGDRYIVSGAVGDWFDDRWTYRQEVEIDGTYVYADESELGYGVRVIIPAGNDIFTNAQDTGYDVMFTGSDKETPLYCEREWYHDANQQAVFWVKVDSLEAATNRTLYMYYGNTDVIDWYCQPSESRYVWMVDYGGVYHMNVSGNDSTGNKGHITTKIGNGPSAADNQEGYGTLGRAADGKNVSAWSMKDIKYWEAGYNYRTYNVVFNTTANVVGTTPNLRQVLYAEGIYSSSIATSYQGHMCYIRNSRLFCTWWKDYNTSLAATISTPIVANHDLYVLSAVFNSSTGESLPIGQSAGTVMMYLDGVLIGTANINWTRNANAGDGGIFYTGASSKRFYDTSTTGQYFNGSIHELQMIDKVQSLEQHQTFNMMWQDEFMAFSSPEDRFGGASGAWAGKENNITQYNGASWDFFAASDGWATLVLDEDLIYVYDAAIDAWIISEGLTVSHRNLRDLLGCDPFTKECWHHTYEQWKASTRIVNESGSGLMSPALYNLLQSGIVAGVEPSYPLSGYFIDNIIYLFFEDIFVNTTGDTMTGDLNLTASAAEYVRLTPKGEVTATLRMQLSDYLYAYNNGTFNVNMNYSVPSGVVIWSNGTVEIGAIADGYQGATDSYLNLTGDNVTQLNANKTYWLGYDSSLPALPDTGNWWGKVLSDTIRGIYGFFDYISVGTLGQFRVNETGGINLTTQKGCNLETDTSGNVICGVDDTGGDGYGGVDDVWVNETGDIMTGNLTMGGNWIIDFMTDLGWFNLTDFPNDCGAGEYVFGIFANGTFRCREDTTGVGGGGQYIFESDADSIQGSNSSEAHKIFNWTLSDILCENIQVEGTVLGLNLVASGNIEATGTIMAGSDIYTSGSGDDLWLGTEEQETADWKAYANGSLSIASGACYINDTGGFSLTLYKSCTALETDTAGNLVCGVDDTGDGAYPGDIWVNETGDTMDGSLHLINEAGLFLNVTNCNTLDTDSEGYVYCGIDETGGDGTPTGDGLFTWDASYIHPSNVTTSHLAINWTENNIYSNNTYLGQIGQSQNACIYFAEAGSYSESMCWDDFNDKLLFTDDFRITGSFEASYIYASNDVDVTGNLYANEDFYTTGPGDDLWLGTAIQGNANWQAYASGGQYMEGDLNMTSGDNMINISSAGHVKTQLRGINYTSSSLDVYRNASGYSGPEILRDTWEWNEIIETSHNNDNIMAAGWDVDWVWDWSKMKSLSIFYLNYSWLDLDMTTNIALGVQPAGSTIKALDIEIGPGILPVGYSNYFAHFTSDNATRFTIDGSGNTYTTGTLAVDSDTRISGTTGLNITAGRIDNAKQPKVRAYNSATDVNLNGGTWTLVDLDSETFDPFNKFATDRYTPTVEGYYMVTGQVTLAQAVTLKPYSVAIYKNGAMATNTTAHAGVADTLTITTNDIIYLDSNDYVELWVKSMSGGNTVDVVGNSGGGATYMAAYMLG